MYQTWEDFVVYIKLGYANITEESIELVAEKEDIPVELIIPLTVIWLQTNA